MKKTASTLMLLAATAAALWLQDYFAASHREATRWSSEKTFVDQERARLHDLAARFGPRVSLVQALEHLDEAASVIPPEYR